MSPAILNWIGTFDIFYKLIINQEIIVTFFSNIGFSVFFSYAFSPSLFTSYKFLPYY